MASNREKAIAAARKKVKEKLVRRDNLIVQAVKAIDLLDKTGNLYTEQVRSWYGLYFPELAREVKSNDEYLSLVSEMKVRGKFSGKLKDKAAVSVGGDFPGRDVDQMAAFAGLARHAREQRSSITDYLDRIMQEEAPNITAVIGSTIGARLIATAGSLKKLAEMPSSTIQVLGAEKALFAHLKKGVGAPKHGLIFSYPPLRSADKSARGKIARKIAAKLSIAAKLDYFAGEFQGDRLREELGREISKLG